MPYDPPPQLAELSLEEIAAEVAARRLPPVEEWSPARVVESGMRIAGDGTWFHHDGPINRIAMIRAFASLLMRRSDGAYALVTPFERQNITVEDAPFIAVDMQQSEGALAFRLNTDELIIAGPEHPIRAAGEADRPALYVMVRRGCEARLNRSTYTQLADIALEQSGGTLAGLNISSQGAAFSLVPS